MEIGSYAAALFVPPARAGGEDRIMYGITVLDIASDGRYVKLSGSFKKKDGNIREDWFDVEALKKLNAGFETDFRKKGAAA